MTMGRASSKSKIRWSSELARIERLWFAKTLADFEINDLAASPAPVLL